MHKITVRDILRRKQKERRKITVLTAYDFPFAKLVDEAGIDVVLVGDSVGMVCLGYESTLPVTMLDMIHHVKAVKRAVKHALIVADMPFGSYRSAGSALRNAKRLTRGAGADGVKVEGGEKILSQVKALVREGISVVGHLGMTPQSVVELGGYKVQGKTREEAGRILKEAKELEKAGVFSIVLECVPRSLAKKVTHALRIPTIGIGAGSDTDGQVLVLHDLLGFESPFRPRFVRRYAELGQVIRKAFDRYRNDVLRKKFPSAKESFQG
ncbi:MAG: 3-methyl-2-oxobutanoate hydroxymethyltransferase [Candidatus Omnitrophica bacterium]|nr:3-methyl-2-oxobutanoate hydroxymethyltransferase [Candidatus Omnitrophota bacterium]